MKKNKLYIPLLILIVLPLLGYFKHAGATDSCPNDPPWVKIDSDDLTQLPDDYQQACFKYGSVNSNGCIGGVSNTWPPQVDGKYCGLSHFSYIPNTPTLTPTIDPSGTPTPTIEISLTVTPTLELRITPTIELTVTPTLTTTPTVEPTKAPEVSQEKWEETRKVEGWTFGPQK